MLPGIKLGAEIGRGQFSTVFVARRTAPAAAAAADKEGDAADTGEDECLVAVKRQHLRQQEALDEYLVRELEVMGKLQHRNVIAFLGSHDIHSSNGWSLFIITEFAPGGDLMMLLDSPQDLSRRFLAGLAVGICRGLAHVHENGFIHRDVKSENVLLAAGWIPKLADFGMARPVEGDEAQFMTICGTDEYMAPELLFDEAYGAAADVYGLGMVLCEVLARKPVGRDGFAERTPQTTFQLDVDALRAELEKAEIPSLVELAVQCLEYEHGNRVTAPDAAGWAEDLVADLEADPDTAGPVPTLPAYSVVAPAPDPALAEPETGLGPEEERAAHSSQLFVDALSSDHVRRSLARGSVQLKKGPAFSPRVSVSKGNVTLDDAVGIRLHYGGVLFKKSTGLFRQWHRRWFELDSEAIRWFYRHPGLTDGRARALSYANGERRRASGCILISKHMSCKFTESKANRFALFIRTPDGGAILLREFAGRTNLDVQTWVTLIEAAIGASKNDCWDPEVLLASEFTPNVAPPDGAAAVGAAAR